MEQEQQPGKKVRWTNPHTDGDYEYTNKLSGNPWPSLIAMIIIGAAFMVFAVIRYRELVAWEQKGGNMRMNSLEKLCYDMAGPWLFSALVAAVAIMVVAMGFREFNRRMKFKREHQQQQ
ncbi:hypothetical protein [Chitinophaga sp. 212800010-3]|uniref:hypothetical protein n=1 Tax=unclassified Chitinophaga TaxID=2619133 RepID=UPI002DE9CF57|nr:hypothetical protein [Chitinophaga sp. 212800010-3]